MREDNPACLQADGRQGHGTTRTHGKKINLPYQKLEGVFRDYWEIGEALPRLLTLCFPWKQWQPENIGATSLKYCKKKILHTCNSMPNENIFGKWRLKTFSDMQELKEFITIRPELQNMFKLFKQKENNTRWKYGSTEEYPK